MFVTSFWFSRKIRDYSSYESNYAEVLHSSVFGLYCDKTKLFLISWAKFSRPHGAWLLTSFESHQYMPVIKQRQLAHLKTTFNDEKFFLSECTTYLNNYIYLLLSSFFVQMQVVRRSLSLSIKIIYNQVLRDKKKEPAVFWSANFSRLPRQFKYILNNFRLSKLEERMEKKKKV